MATFTFDFINQRIKVDSPATSFTVQELLNAIRTVEDTYRGIGYRKIANASGKDSLGGGVQVGITVQLLENWQVEWYPGSYVATVGGGNIVADIGDVFADVIGGPQIEMTLSAAATIVNSSGATPPTADEIATAVLTKASGIETNYTLQQALRILLSVAAGKTAITDLGGGNATVEFRDINDTKNRVIADMQNSERISVTKDAS